MNENRECKEISRKLDQIIFLLRIQNKSSLENQINNIFSSKEEFEVYDLTDGYSSIDELAEKTLVPRSTIGDWWKKWLDCGITIPGPIRNDRPQKIFSKKEIEKYYKSK
ncbi:MAG TPA: hypothetical protein PLL88_01995 [Anaerolineaceae bacterium]|nr:hypothetical protein [Anaerolineaceae bacterium]